jgi:hypothetical protein
MKVFVAGMRYQKWLCSGIWLLIVTVAGNLSFTMKQTNLIAQARTRFKQQSSFGFGIQLRGGGGPSDRDDLSFDQVLRLAEDMRKRIPSDEEVRNCSEIPIALDNAKAEADLRYNLDSFNVHAFGVSDLQGTGSGKEEEDELGPLILLRSFWETEVYPCQQLSCFSGNGNDILRNPLNSSMEYSSWNKFAYELNSKALDAAASWPGICGADRVRSLPSVRGLGEHSDGLSVAASCCFRTNKFRSLMMKLLEFVVDGGIAGAVHPGLIQIALFLYLLLPMTTTARIISVLQRSDKYLLGYWSEDAGAIHPAKLRADAVEWGKLVETTTPRIAQKLASCAISLESTAQDWFSSLFFNILKFSTRSAKRFCSPLPNTCGAY